MSALLHRWTLFLAFAGIFVAGYLSYSHFAKITVPCGANSACNFIQNHPSSQWFGIPVAVFGLGAYLTLALLGVLRSKKGLAGSTKLGILMINISGLGTVISLYLSYYALSELRARCDWCLASAAIMTLLFLSLAALHGLNQESEGNPSADLPLVAAFAVLALGGIGGVATTQQRLGAQTKSVANVTVDSLIPFPDMFEGAKDAPVTVIEFADFYCPGCRSSYPELRRLLQTFPGKVRIAFGHYPLFNKPGHELSADAAAATMFARESGRYWQAVAALMETDVQNISDRAGLMKTLANIGLDIVALEGRLAKGDETLIEPVATMQAAAVNAGAQGTPSYFIFAPGRPVALAQGQVETILRRDYAKELGLVQ